MLISTASISLSLRTPSPLSLTKSTGVSETRKRIQFKHFPGHEQGYACREAIFTAGKDTVVRQLAGKVIAMHARARSNTANLCFCHASVSQLSAHNNAKTFSG
jgi:hypothetical protein